MPTQWLVILGGPLLGDMRAAIDATGTRLDEYVPQHAYVATATLEQATDCINLSFVRDVERYGPRTTGPIVLTEDPPVRGDEQTRSRAWDLWLSDDAVRHSVLASLEAHDDLVIVGSGGRKVRIELGPDPRCSAKSASCPGCSAW